jgi:RNA polymerase primary sigma factor
MKYTSELDMIMFKEVSKNNTISRDEELILFKRYKLANGIEKINIRNKIISANIKFVLKVANHYSKITGVDVNDLMSEGKIGLLMSVDTFDYNTNNKFISHAIWQIKAYIISYIQNNTLIRLPIAVKTYLSKIKREHKLDELTDQHKILMNLIDAHYSFDCKVNDTENTLQETIKDDRELVDVSDIDSNYIVNAMKNVLTNDEYNVLSYLFGLTKSETEYTIYDTHIYVGKSKERIRQIRDKALKKLRSSEYSNELKSMLINNV